MGAVREGEVEQLDAAVSVVAVALLMLPRGLANRPRHGQMMSSSDLRFVTEKVMFPLRFDDPYTQDFYYLQKSVKSNAIAREKAVREQTEMPSMIMVPQPLWRDFKERIINTVNNQRAKLLSKGKEWEEKEQVLGHVQRTWLHNQRVAFCAHSQCGGAGRRCNSTLFLSFMADAPASSARIRGPWHSTGAESSFKFLEYFCGSLCAWRDIGRS